MRVALIYDRVNKWGGAERVLVSLHELFPDAPLYTSVYNPETAPWARIFPKVIPSFLSGRAGSCFAGQKWVSRHHEWLAPLMPLAFESFDFSEYDLVISVTSEAAKGIITRPGTLHICYCLTPTRYLWSGYDEYFKCARGRLAQPAVSYLRTWDKIAAQRPDVMVAISQNVADRIKRYYGREAKIIYPPVELQSTKSQAQNFKQIQNTKFKILNSGYFLIVSRLVPYKKVDLAVKAFNELGLPLVVVGTGSEENSLRKQSKSNIKFVGQVSDDELARYYQGCRALIFPQEEDFGIVAVEAQAAGKSVIAYRAGGALETVIEGKTGMFFDEQTSEALAGVIKKFKPEDFNPVDCAKNSARFSKQKFLKEFATLILATKL